jgi:signal transduction histidine kinase
VGRTIRCSIGDDGIGFDLSAVCPNRDKPGLGLIGIRERIAALGGSLSIVSALGRGTTLEMEIPLKNSRRSDAAKLTTDQSTTAAHAAPDYSR